MVGEGILLLVWRMLFLGDGFCCQVIYLLGGVCCCQVGNAVVGWGMFLFREKNFGCSGKCCCFVEYFLLGWVCCCCLGLLLVAGMGCCCWAGMLLLGEA